jgi:DNA-binding beta-propeller fold protein YncE
MASLTPLRFSLAISVLSLASAAQSFVNWESPHVYPLDMSPDGARLLAVNTADNRLEVFDLSGASPQHELSIPVGLDPVSVRARTNNEVWVVNHVSDSVSIVDLSAGGVVETLTTDDEPCDVLFAGTPERAFVSCSQANTVLVFDPADLSIAPTRIDIRGEDPRALAKSPSGGEVYVAVFESGNQTTVLGGGVETNLAFPPNVVNDSDGPHGGVNPPPNDGSEFNPPQSPGLPQPPAVSLIVRQKTTGEWLDDNDTDWTAKVSGADAADSGRPVGWTLLDHDVAVIDATTLAVSYVDGLMNINMALAVNPASGQISVIGTDAYNHVRYEPNLNGVFLRVHLALADPATPASATVSDLNTHLDYNLPTLPVSDRVQSISDPRGIVWNSAGSRAYVTGMGTNNVVVVDAGGARAGIQPTIDVGEGPTGIALDEARGRLYVMNKFEASISFVDTTSELQLGQVGFYDPSPAAIQRGRRHLYNATETSGTGLVACGSCHVDARMDRLAWDLGNPAGQMQALEGNLGANAPGLNSGFEDWHPMKGPMLTQTLQDIIGKEPHHWRGDRTGIEAFNPAFEGLLGDDEQLTDAEMQEFEDFLATIQYPPNPFRNFNNSLPTNLDLEGHYTTGRFGPAGLALPNGNAVQGQQLFRPPNVLDGGALACVTCHTRPTGAGTDHELVSFTYQPIPVGSDGEHHLALVSVDGATNVTMKVPQLRNIYERSGFNTTQLESTAGFGYLHDGSVDSIERFLAEPIFTFTSVQEIADVTAFMLSFGGGRNSLGSPTEIFEPPGPPSHIAHAAVGVQTTLRDGASPDPARVALIDAMIAEALVDDVSVVVKGRVGGEARGWMFTGPTTFQSDRAAETISLAALKALAGTGSELTFTVVPEGSQLRIGVDRDLDGYFDRDELDKQSDPADPAIRPRHRFLPGGSRL